MNPTNNKEQLQKVRVSTFINLIALAISMIILFKSVDSGILWKIITSSIGFIGFAGLTILSFRQMRKLQKSE